MTDLAFMRFRFLFHVLCARGTITNWLEVWNMLHFSSFFHILPYLGNKNLKWLIFLRGVAQPPISQQFSILGRYWCRPGASPRGSGARSKGGHFCVSAASPTWVFKNEKYTGTFQSEEFSSPFCTKTALFAPFALVQAKLHYYGKNWTIHMPLPSPSAFWQSFPQVRCSRHCVTQCPRSYWTGLGTSTKCNKKSRVQTRMLAESKWCYLIT